MARDRRPNGLSAIALGICLMVGQSCCGQGATAETTVGNRNDTLPVVSLPDAIRLGELDCVHVHNSKERGRITVFRKPATPDPFVNAKLTHVGVDGTGRERLLISCLSGLAGSASFLITEDGEWTTYRWSLGYVYGVAQESPDVLWLAGAQKFVRLNLASGESEEFSGGPRFITAGMAFDAETGKLLGGAQHELVSFDTRTGKVVRVYEGEAERSPDSFPYDHWRLPDGSYGFILETPGLSFLRWDPKGEDIRWQRLTADSSHPAIGLVTWLKYVENDRLYLPHLGWLEGVTGEITPHECPPQQEACWLERRGNTVYGVQSDNLKACATMIAWDVTTGRTTSLFTVPNTSASGCALTRRGKLLSVDLYGTLRRHDLATCELELEKTLESEHEHRCNVILPAGNDCVVGTPFISMNFWSFDVQTGKGFHGGRVAGSYGQCDYAVQVGGKIYFAIYGGGQLTEYDPAQPAGFPRNPRVVAQNGQGQHGAGMTTDGRVVWVAFKPKYGTLDGAMIRYDTETGEASYCNGTISGQTVVAPVFDAGSGHLVAGTTFLSDASTAAPVHDRVFAVLLDPRSMEVVHKVPGPAGVQALVNIGPLDTERWLMQGGGKYYLFDTKTVALTPWRSADSQAVGYAGRPGRFLIQRDCLELWDAVADTFTPLASWPQGFVQRWWVHGPDLTFDCGPYAAYWRGAVPAPEDE